MSKEQILSSVADLVMGQSPPSTSYNDTGDGLPLYQGKTDFGSIYPTPRKYCTEPKKIAEPGDILISVRAPVGTTNLCKDQSCIGRGIAAIRAKDIDHDFLFFYLRKIESYIDSLGSGAIFKAINKSQLSELPINKADIKHPEQKKIAHILSTVQRAIEAQERIIATTTELKKALMQKLFTEGGDYDKLGRGFIWHGQIENCVHQNHVFAVRPNSNQLSSEFFAYQSQSPYGKKYFLSVAHKTTNLACINTTKLKAFPVLLPSKNEQHKVVEACQSVDGKIKAARNKKDVLEDLFRTLLHELMTAKTRVHELDI